MRGVARSVLVFSLCFLSELGWYTYYSDQGFSGFPEDFSGISLIS